MNRFVFSGFVLLLLTVQASAGDLIIRNAKLHTGGDAGVIGPGQLLIRDGRIAQMGENLATPDGATVIDAKGRPVTAGLFSALSTIGLSEISLSADPTDYSVEEPNLNAAIDVADAFNPRSSLIPVSRIEGLTRSLIAPRSPKAWLSKPPGNLIAGQAAVVNLGTGKGWLDRRSAALLVTLGEHGADFGGGSRAGALGLLREALSEARDWSALGEPARSELNAAYAQRAASRSVLAKAVSGELPVLARVHRAADIEALLALADEFELKLILAGAKEAWMLAARLAERNVGVIMDPTANLPSSFESLGARDDAAAILHAAGVTIAFSADEAHNARNIKQLAGNAVAHGLPWEAALAAITVNPARLFGLDQELGTLMPGMRGDAVVWSGDPLEVTEFADAVIIDGVLMPMVSRQTLMRDRYMQFHALGRARPPAYINPTAKR